MIFWEEPLIPIHRYQTKVIIIYVSKGQKEQVKTLLSYYPNYKILWNIKYDDCYIVIHNRDKKIYLDFSKYGVATYLSKYKVYNFFEYSFII